MPAPEYRHLVDTQGNRGRLYDGTDAADAMAAWSKAISEGAEYVTLESLIRAGSPVLPPPPERVAITVQHGAEMVAHDGFAEHCHAIRQDHIGVARVGS